MAAISNTSRTPSTPKPPSLKKSSSGSQSSKSQKSITGFFQKKTAETSQENPRLPAGKKSSKVSSSSLTPAPSSDAPEYPEEMDGLVTGTDAQEKSTGLPSPITPLDGGKTAASRNPIKLPFGFSSPSRKVSWMFILRISWIDRSLSRQRKQLHMPNLGTRMRMKTWLRLRSEEGGL